MKVKAIRAGIYGQGDAREGEINLEITIKVKAAHKKFINAIHDKLVEDNKINSKALVAPKVVHLQLSATDGKLALSGKVAIGDGQYLNYCINDYISAGDFLKLIFGKENE